MGETPAAPKIAKSDGENFGQMLMDALKEVNDAQLQSRNMQTELAAGRKVDFQDVGIAMERASIAMQLTMQVRNKLLDAYQEIQRMQV